METHLTKMLAIGEVARRAGVNTSTVRYYESLGLLPKSSRVHGHRRFESSVVDWLGLIQFAQQAGFTLAEIETLLHGFDPEATPSERWQTLARQKMPEIDALIERARGMKRMLENGLQCGCLKLEDCATLLGKGC
jgi:MerR family redox-sensitive transcriptional activator SoxR